MPHGRPTPITAAQVMPLLLTACPSFTKRWENDTQEYNLDEEGRLYYLDAGDFIRHLCVLTLADRLDEFDAVFDVIERLVTEGDDYVATLGVIGYIEGFQMQTVSSFGLDPAEVFRPYFRPTTEAYWQAVDRFWEDRTPIPSIPPQTW